ncbi:minor tail protein [Gordonia phage Ligma]|nr:minor tail protein [Gordonia phage Ligma]UQT02128.1 minor tail protein [Gordonia phage Axumite]
MTIVNPGKAPTTDAEWAREVSKRLAQLENSTTVRIGPWVISSGADGALRATSPSQTLDLGTVSGVDEEAVEGIIRSAGFATPEQVAAVQDSVDGVQGQVNSQASSITDIFADLTDLFNFGTAQQGQIDAVVARLDEIDTTFGTTPAYVADLGDMATAPRSQLVVPRFTGGAHDHGAGSYGANTTTGNVTGTSSSSTIGTLTRSYEVPFYSPDKLSFSSTSYVDYTPVVVDREGVIVQMRWVCGLGGLFDVDAYYMALCAYDPNTGNILKLWDSGNIASYTNYSSVQEIEWDLDLPQECSPGQVLFVAHQQIAPGAAQPTRPFAAVPQGGIGRPSTLLLDAPTYRTTTRTGSIPSSVSKAGLQKINDRIPWVALAVSVME